MATNKLNKDIKKLEERIRGLNKNFKELRVNFDKNEKSVLKNWQALKKYGQQVLQNISLTGNLKGSLTKLRKEKKLQDKADIGFIRNQRNLAGSFSVLRSKILLASFALNGTRKIIDGLIGSFAEYDAAVKRLTTAFARTGYVAGVTTSQIVDYAAELQKLTGISDTLIVNSAGLLATFTNVRDDAFIRGTEAIVQMTDAMYYGAVTQENLRTTTIQMGKALNDPIKGMTALRRVGVTFSETQKLQIHNFVRMNDLASAQAVILDELDDEFANTANIDTYSKSVGKLSTAFGDIQKKIGGWLEPVMKGVVDSLTRLAEAVDLADIQIAALTTGVSLLVGSFYALFTAVSITMPWVLAITAAVGAATLGISSYVTENREWELSVDKTTKALEKQFELVKGGSLQDYEKALENVKKAMTDPKVRMDKDLFPVFLTDEQLTKMEAQLTAHITFLTKEKDALMAIVTSQKLEQDQLIATNKLKREALETAKASKRIVGERGEDVLLTRADRYNDERKAIEELSKIAAKHNKTVEDWNKAQPKQFDLAKEAIIERIRLKREEKAIDEGMAKAEQLRAQRNAAAIQASFQIASNAATTYFNIRQDTIRAEQEILNKSYDDERELIINSVKTEKQKASALEKLNQQRVADEKKMHNKMIDFQIYSAIAQGAIAVLGIGVNTLIGNSKLVSQLGVGAPPAVAANTSLGAIQAGMAALQTGLSIAQLNAQKKQYGGDQIVTSPTLFMAGEGAGAERVSITPIGGKDKATGGQGGSININFSGNVLSKDFIEEEAIPLIRDAIRRGGTI